MFDFKCSLFEFKFFVFELRFIAINSFLAFGLSFDYFFNLYNRIFAFRVYNFEGFRLSVLSLFCLFVWRIYL